MKLGYQKGMISIYDIGNMALLYEPSSPMNIIEEYRTHVKEAENTPEYYRYLRNLKYLVHISKAILSIKNEKINFAVRIFLHDLIKKYFDEKYSYDWQELKSILFYCNYFSNVNTFKNFAQKIRNPFFYKRLHLYLSNDSVIP
ncbi:MAG TPA: hypothetical protein VIJ95_17140 [Hanamia sp.]